MSLKHRIIACFWTILLLPIAPVLLASEYEYSTEYRDLSIRVFKIYMIAMWVISITVAFLLVFL
nr:MAG TPA: hypothetical protein [Caudoviricetes sp.]